MSNVTELENQYAEYATSLISQGIMNDQFNRVQNLQDEANPKFVSEIVTVYIGDTKKLINDLTVNLQQPNVDFQKLDKTLHHMKGSSSSIGAGCVLNVCNAFVACCEAKNVDGCLACLEQAKNAYTLVKIKLETLLMMEQQIVAAGGSVPKPPADY